MALAPTKRAFPNRKLTIVVILATVVIVAPVVWFLAAFARVFIEQGHWLAHRNPARLAVKEIRYAKEGILLNVYAPGGVAEAWKQATTFNPFRRQHYACQFRIAGTTNAGTAVVMVDYPFAPGREWLVALRSTDGSWWSGSPYFPIQPDVPDAEWATFKTKSREQLPK